MSTVELTISLNILFNCDQDVAKWQILRSSSRCFSETHWFGRRYYAARCLRCNRLPGNEFHAPNKGICRADSRNPPSCHDSGSILLLPCSRWFGTCDLVNEMFWGGCIMQYAYRYVRSAISTLLDFEFIRFPWTNYLFLRFRPKIYCLRNSLYLLSCTWSDRTACPRGCRGKLRRRGVSRPMRVESFGEKCRFSLLK